MDFVTASTGLISPYWMGLPIRYIQLSETISRQELMAMNGKNGAVCAFLHYLVSIFG